MNEEWKTQIMNRIKQRNIYQNEIYKDMLCSYNKLLDEKKELLAIIASFTTNNNYFPINNINYSLLLNQAVTLTKQHSNNDDFLTMFNSNIDYNVNQKNGNDSHYSTNNALSQPVNTFLNNCEHKLLKKEIVHVIKEKNKDKEIISLLKNNLIEKDKVLNILNKENKVLNNVIIKNEVKLLKKKKTLSKSKHMLNIKNKELKLYVNNNNFLKNQIELKKKQNRKIFKEYDYLKQTCFKLLKETYEMKNYKKKITNEYFALRKEFYKKKIENENLLKHLLKFKNSYKRNLKKIQKKTKQKIKKLHTTNKVYKKKIIFFKKKKVYVRLYLNKLRLLHTNECL
ncbi:conserved protein, unknown function [Hepatocystis sp. ex Piliocolobus tephrosceles]|nr:conserved protein, unknown function [Hepatocystis sp. ex Piliocolobus tephrosceles]